MATEMEGYFSDDDTYVLSFDGDFFDATLTESGGRVESWVAETYRIHRSCRHPLVVGLDVEWRPAAPVPGPVAVLQICTDRRCLVFQILHADHGRREQMNALGHCRCRCRLAWPACRVGYCLLRAGVLDAALTVIDLIARLYYLEDRTTGTTHYCADSM
ncbi:hypothetical protein SORBI_3003G288900 [Sorghum bicolor]|uniref:3'-5' exonuclease domain-containing protein n=1 Tax=Sorghum bicolor TaxID=4558 RepID=A0A1B6Q5X9_SORBI|nr:hypothetical protein SORBI_3003G288900 [Sorghum bicolor]